MVNLNHLCLTKECVRCSCSPGCPPAGTLARDGNAYLERDAARRRRHEGGWKGGGGELMPGGSKQGSVKDISHL